MLVQKEIPIAEHPSEEEFGRSGGNAHPLKLERLAQPET